MNTVSKNQNRLVTQFGHPRKASMGLLVLCLTAVGATAQTFSVVSSVGGSAGQFLGVNPVSDGTTLYGMTRNYVFRVDHDGTDCAGLRWYYENDTGPSEGGLTLSGSALFVAARHYGLISTNFGHGAVFKLNTDGTGFTMLKLFVGDSDGDQPFGAPILNGTNLYCATLEGVVFRLDTNGTDFSVIKRLDGHASGDLLLANAKIYGNTSTGGTNRVGTVYSMNLDGTDFTVLHSFTGGTGGSYAQGGLALGGATLYGLTLSGGTPNRGTVFKINTDGTGFTVLHEFTDGSSPQGNLALCGPMLYGSTQHGGTFDQGTLFQINTNGGDFATIKHFNGSDGTGPRSGLVKIGDTLYGTTYFGGSDNSGVLYSLSIFPEILSAPESQTTELGSAVRFRVNATPPPLSYFWFHNETNALLGATNSFLDLPSAQTFQAGTYTVMIGNDCGAVTSAPAMLNVIPPVDRRSVPAMRLSAETGTTTYLDYSAALLPSPGWLLLDTIPIASTPQWYFDLSTPPPPQRFYRTWQTGSPAMTPALSIPGMVPALTLTGTVGSNVRVEGINQIGPTDAWFTLATVTMTNTTQFYFDVTAPGQPARLYRLVPMP